MKSWPAAGLNYEGEKLPFQSQINANITTKSLRFYNGKHNEITV